MKKFLLFACMAIYANIAVAQDLTVQEKVFDRQAYEDSFAFGADISWLSQQESWGTYYCNRKGKRADLMTILKEDFGLNALRFRVWVNPSGGWSGKNDVIGLCKRAHAMGFKIMISFHYSDTWADSGSQTIPAQWTDHSAEALAQNVYDHTKDVLSGLKAEGIIPVWVSLGNETKYGMLYETGRTKTTEGIQNFVKFINAGAKAVKEIDPNIITIIHLPNGHDEATARNMFDNLKKYGANYDAIGLSAYPRWSHLDVTTDANISSTINKYITVFKNLKARFNKPVIVVETGHYVDQPYDANRFLAEFMKALINDGELGCFFWEPEAFDNSGYNLGAWSSATHQATIAMDAYMGIKHTKVDKYATVIINSPKDEDCMMPGESMNLSVIARSSNSITSLIDVSFFLNGKKVYSVKPEGKQTSFPFMTDPLEVGKYQFYSVVTDDQGHSQTADTICFMAADAVFLQEDAEGFDASGYPDMQIKNTVKKYTGKGYIPESNAKEQVTWNVFFPSPGTYHFFIRYHSDLKKHLKIITENKSTLFSCQPSPSGRWDYIYKTINIEESGLKSITVAPALGKGLPDIDFLAIASPDGGEKVSTSVADNITNFEFNNDFYKTNVIFDLQGRVVSSENLNDLNMNVLQKGIYIINGKKIIIR